MTDSPLFLIKQAFQKNFNYAENGRKRFFNKATRVTFEFFENANLTASLTAEADGLSKKIAGAENYTQMINAILDGVVNVYYERIFHKKDRAGFEACLIKALRAIKTAIKDADYRFESCKLQSKIVIKDLENLICRINALPFEDIEIGNSAIVFKQFFRDFLKDGFCRDAISPKFNARSLYHFLPPISWPSDSLFNPQSWAPVTAEDLSQILETPAFKSKLIGGCGLNNELFDQHNTRALAEIVLDQHHIPSPLISEINSF